MKKFLQKKLASEGHVPPSHQPSRIKTEPPPLPLESPPVGHETQPQLPWGSQPPLPLPNHPPLPLATQPRQLNTEPPLPLDPPPVDRTYSQYQHQATLPVYTFCRDYQNKVCPHHPCKFVHATISEEAAYYRTGVLPQRCVAHFKRTMPPPPPPPPPSLPEMVANARSVLAALVLTTPESKTLVPTTASLPSGSVPTSVASVPTPMASSSGVPPYHGEDMRVTSTNAPQVWSCDSCHITEEQLAMKKIKIEYCNQKLREEKEKETQLADKERRLNELCTFLQALVTYLEEDFD